MTTPDHPLVILEAWLDQARGAEVAWSDAFVLATATTAGRPSARAVVLRRLDQRGLVFFSDAGSRKALELAQNPWASAVFVWPVLRRQVRVEGQVVPLADRDSDAIFAERPARARSVLWAWRQGQVVAGAADLAARLQRAQAATGEETPRPPYWLGYRLAAAEVEFWQERGHGLHERARHRLTSGDWKTEVLAP